MVKHLLDLYVWNKYFLVNDVVKATSEFMHRTSDYRFLYSVIFLMNVFAIIDIKFIFANADWFNTIFHRVTTFTKCAQICKACL